MNATELNAKRHEIAYCQALSYVWGRQDAGDGEHDTSRSQEFAIAYRDRLVAYTSEKTCFMPNIRDAFEEWSKTGVIA